MIDYKFKIYDRVRVIKKDTEAVPYNIEDIGTVMCYIGNNDSISYRVELDRYKELPFIYEIWFDERQLELIKGE